MEKEVCAELDAAFPGILGFDGQAKYSNEQNTEARHMSSKLIAKYSAKFDAWFEDYVRTHPPK